MTEPDFEQYRPYKADWRFLPQAVLYAKDSVRHHLTRALDYGAESMLGVRAARCSVRAAGTVFVHIPKTGGSAISKALYGRNLPHRVADVYRDELRFLPSFAVIRDPVERFVSAYRFMIAGGSRVVAANSFETAWVRSSGSIDAFALQVARKPWHIRTVKPLMEQSRFVFSAEGEQMVDRLYGMAGDVFPMQLLARYGPFERVNVSIGPRVTIAAETAALVRRVYARDQALFERISLNGGELIGSD